MRFHDLESGWDQARVPVSEATVKLKGATWKVKAIRVS